MSPCCLGQDYGADGGGDDAELSSKIGNLKVDCSEVSIESAKRRRSAGPLEKADRTEGNEIAFPADRMVVMGVLPGLRRRTHGFVLEQMSNFN
jgi:hypothetical protein